MKKLLISASFLAGGVLAASADPVWTTTTDGTSVTYTAEATGSFTWSDLGEAAIKDGESFTLKMEFSVSNNPWPQSNAITAIAARGSQIGDLYDLGGENDAFRVYLRPSDSFIELKVNGWTYSPTADAEQDQLTNVSFDLPETVSAETPLTYGFSFQYVNNDDAPGNDDYWIFAPTEESMITFDAHTDANVVRTFNFADLTNYTASYNNADASTITKISITKAIPEPSAFGLLAGAGALALVAARRRRSRKA